MPSSKALTNVKIGAGKLHPNVATAASDFQTDSGALLASIIEALNQELAEPTHVDLSVSAGASSVVLSGSTYGPIWLGASGETARDLFDITTLSNDVRPSSTGNLPIFVNTISGGSVGSGFFSTNNITLNLSGSITTTSTYRIHFSKKKTLRTLDTGFLASMRRFVPDPGYLEGRIYEIVWANTSNTWNGTIGTWDTTVPASIRALALAGLNERYNRNSGVPSGANPNTNGDGHLINRTGPAVEIWATRNSFSYSSPAPDPFLAHFLTRAGLEVRSSSYNASDDGGSGYVSLLQQKLSTSGNELTGTQALSTASCMDLIERDIPSSAIGTGVVKTSIDVYSNFAYLNPDAGTSDDDRRTVQLDAGSYFWENSTGNKLSEVAVGYDMLEVTISPSGEVFVYVITELDPANNRRAFLRDLTGGLPGFPSGAITASSVRLLKTKRFRGVGYQALRAKVGSATDPVRLGYDYTAITPPITTDPGATGSDEIDPGCVEIYAQGVSIGNDYLVNKPVALKWGGLDSRTYQPTARGFLRGDGAVECTQTNRKVRRLEVSTTSTITWHPSIEGSVLHVVLTHTSGLITVTIDLDTDYTTNIMQEGDELTVIINNSIDAPISNSTSFTAEANFNWPSEFYFNGADKFPNRTNSTGGGPGITIHKYHGILAYVSGSYNEAKFLMTLDSYMGLL